MDAVSATGDRLPVRPRGERLKWTGLGLSGMGVITACLSLILPWSDYTVAFPLGMCSASAYSAPSNVEPIFQLAFYCAVGACLIVTTVQINRPATRVFTYAAPMIGVLALADVGFYWLLRGQDPYPKCLPTAVSMDRGSYLALGAAVALFAGGYVHSQPAMNEVTLSGIRASQRLLSSAARTMTPGRLAEERPS